MKRRKNKRPQQPRTQTESENKGAADQATSSVEGNKPEPPSPVSESVNAAELETNTKLVPPPVGKALSTEQLKRRAELEKIVDDGLPTSLAVCLALAEIKDTGLYCPCESFRHYCRERWPYAKSTCYQYAQSGHALRLVQSAVADSPCPQNEAQLRPLRDLNDDQVIEVWSKAVTLAGKDALSEKVVRKARNMVVERRARKFDPEGEMGKAKRAIRHVWDTWPSEEKPSLIDELTAYLASLREELDQGPPSRLPWRHKNPSKPI